MTKNNDKKIAILGIGNLIIGDEGFGVHTVKYLEDNYDFPENVIIVDAGTAGIYMSPYLEECDPVFVIDVVDIDEEPGSIHTFNLEDVKAGKISTKMSPHQLGLLEVFEICKLRDAAPSQMEFFCVVPADLEQDLVLSPIVEPRVPEIADILIKRLKEEGVTVTRKQSVET